MLLVVAAGAVGALLRYGTTLLAARRPTRVPWAVLLVNVAGSLIAGVAAAAPVGADVRAIVVVGFAGGLTTFSTLSVETIQLVLERRTGIAAASVSANVVVGIAAAGLGWCLGTLLA